MSSGPFRVQGAMGATPYPTQAQARREGPGGTGIRQMLPFR